jgi:hypothetical protein
MVAALYATAARPQSFRRPESTAPPPPPLQAGRHNAFPFWDGASGMTYQSFDKMQQLPWRNPGGDHRDAKGVLQGPAAFAAAPIDQAKDVVIDITALARKWYANGNTGAFLRGSGATFCSRTNSNAALRPYLLINGNVHAECSSNCVLSSSSELPLPLTAEIAAPMCLQFALPDVSSVESVKLCLAVLRREPVGARLAVYEVASPKLFAGGAVEYGLAVGYKNDTRIAEHPDVIHADDFTGKWQAWYNEGGAMGYERTRADPLLGGNPACFTEYRPGDFAAMTLGHSCARAGEQAPEESFLRYYWLFEPDFQCGVQPKKMPGPSGRHGLWNAKSRSWNHTVGNGGNQVDGKIHADGELQGFSLRTLAGQGAWDATPVAPSIPIGTYAYTAEMVGVSVYGITWRWGNADTGYVNCEPGKYYCMETRVRMNTLTGPKDALGNQTANADGVFEAWIDGVKVFSRTNIVYRSNDRIKIDEPAWLDCYHGGTTPAETRHGFRIAKLVVARKYIGPMNTGALPTAVKAPAWLAGKAINEWIALPNTAQRDMDFALLIAAGLTDRGRRDTGWGQPEKGAFVFSGGTRAKRGSRLYIWGGGGNEWAGNEIRGIRLADDAPKWSVLVPPSGVKNVQARGGKSGAYYADGAPTCGHSYSYPQFLDSVDRFILPANGMYWPQDAGYTLAVSGVDMSGPSAGKWIHYTGNARSVPDWPPSVCMHPISETIYRATEVGIQSWALASGWGPLTYLSPGSRQDPNLSKGAMCVNPDANYIFCLSELRSDTERTYAGLVDLTKLEGNSYTSVTLTGTDAAAVSAKWNWSGCGLVWDDGLKHFAFYAGGEAMYQINPKDWRVTKLATTGAPPTPGLARRNGGGCGIFGRMQYMPELNGIVIAQTWDKPVYFVRTS